MGRNNFKREEDDNISSLLHFLLPVLRHFFSEQICHPSYLLLPVATVVASVDRVAYGIAEPITSVAKSITSVAKSITAVAQTVTAIVTEPVSKAQASVVGGRSQTGKSQHENEGLNDMLSKSNSFINTILWYGIPVRYARVERSVLTWSK